MHRDFIFSLFLIFFISWHLGVETFDDGPDFVSSRVLEWIVGAGKFRGYS